MKVGDLVQIDPDESYEDPSEPHQRGIIVDVNACEYMPSYRIYRIVNQSNVWMYEINLRLLNPL